MRIVFIILSLFVTICGYGQHFPIYSQYLLNGLAINPAYAGSRDVLSSSIMYRKQWMGFDGAPATSTFSAHTPLKNRKIGLGLQIVKEEIIAEQNHVLQEKLLSGTEACKLFVPAISRQTLTTWTKEGLIPMQKIGGSNYYKYSDLINAGKILKKYKH